MGEKLEWQERFNIGVDSIDKEHKHLFNTMNKLLYISSQDTKNDWIGQEGIKYFKNHVMSHFSKEEEYMASIGYEGYSTHKQLHDSFKTKTLPSLEEELIQNNFSVDSIRHFLGICIGWLTAHTLIEDQAITGAGKNRWVNLPSEEVISALEHTIMKIVNDMFRLDIRIVSDNYSGEDFGKVVHYRMSYSSAEGQKWDVILIFEESLLLNTVGQMLGIHFKKVDALVINATRQISLQFMDSIRSSFPTMASFQIEKESLLTNEQFVKRFHEQTPKCSFLFNTGAGYLGFCILAPGKPHQDAELDLTPRNMMEEVKKYLDKEKSLKRKQILVVDDSDVIQQSMKKLLLRDYDIALANSAGSAIQCIAKNKPDLILLDYEMPICDGRQTLEMIRSEKEIADIPVIFLTGRGDKESVKKVMSLKPAGYMLKSLKPEEIKKVIDEFFERKNR